MNLKDTRVDYSKGELRKDQIEKDPVDQFKHWFKQAVDMKIPEANAMTIATATPDGIPSARTVLLKDVDKKRFVFFTNYEGRKGRELDQNPHAALLFYWKELERQVRIEGMVEKLGRNESDAYFDSRPLESRISAVVSRQSDVIKDRTHLEERWVQFLQENYEKKINRPAYWGGYRVTPVKMEFWQGRKNRLHDRILYTKQKGQWKIERLEP
jgi:pyridoxamine 5'-phosphate oxidase